MATAVETPEVSVTGQLVPLKEIDRIRNAVCLLKSNTKDQSKSWSASGFYVKVKLKKEEIHCIMTNFHVFQKKQENSDDMVAVFHHESTESESLELLLVPFRLFASSMVLDYVLIRVRESDMKSIGVKPILADSSRLPDVQGGNIVCIIQHPGGMEKHYSHDKVKRVNKPFIEYNADTCDGSSGSPVCILVDSKLLLIALHSSGFTNDRANNPSANWNKGVLLSAILHHLLTGVVPELPTPTPGVPDQMESGSLTVGGKKDPANRVTRDDIVCIAHDISGEWKQLGRALGHSDSTLKIIDADNDKINEILKSDEIPC
ncbi:uncharacterized protein LOC114527833 isoform X2 [Dendronephthya gigantea]|uniref:uncharacterized protein LOC114527833 isoform X2 n=1 Tax=Dendronephthya gigantea TaxID=151771 RepID=UPI00106C17BA|nr:uncharacterized protein LOC114527833 isoform X2 [Dendronephthya gigantea]XP_028405337.1 uncharacterized protein LOC114527833 isoform X2 [Dendronephthya gigantea]